jgi:hypothetical protein
MFAVAYVVISCVFRAYMKKVDEMDGYSGRWRTAAEAPVEVAQQFDRRLKALMDNVILKQNGPLGNVCEFFWRLEYQMVLGLGSIVLAVRSTTCCLDVIAMI